MNPMMGFDFELNCHSNLASSERNLENGYGVGNNICKDVLEPSNLEESNNPLPHDNFDAVLRYLNQMLMEEDLEQRPCMYQDLLALQAAEKSFYDALKGQVPSSNPQITWPNLQSFDPLSPFNGEVRTYGGEHTNITGVRYREDGEDMRRIKQFASYTEEYDPIEKYDKVLLCLSKNPDFYEKTGSEGENNQQKFLPEEPKRGRPRAGSRKPNMREVVDLRNLLTRCAESVAIYDMKTANEILNQIRQHSSPHGDATERLAHCFANALEARISGMGTTLYTAISTKRVSAAETLKGYQTYVLACPFKRMSNIFADKSIGKLTKGASTIHIIDFGILYGFQWPCMIQGLSLRPEGPPKLRITGIDYPQPGFRPAERVEETGRRLARYCKRFNVPFEYNAIAKKWETITLEELKMEKGEEVVVNCLYRLRQVPDEMGETSSSSPRDTVLNLVKKINPDYFIHGVLNGSYNAPLFVTRFRDALFHFSSLFDMFDKILPRTDQERIVYEKEVIGRDIMNVIACEGTERIERPETYKQWQARNRRAGFTQVPLIQAIVKEVRAKVKKSYHKDFLVDEDSNWILQGWKGRVIYAISCWKPTQQQENKGSR